jgi:hypothetical protein
MLTRERSRRAAALTLVLVVTLFTAGFAAKCNGSRKGGGGANANNTATPESERDRERGIDDLLRVKVRQDLTEQSANSNTGLSALDIEVAVVKRKVTLTGSVKSQAAREEAERIARKTEVERNGEKFTAADVDVSGLTVRTPSP